MHAQVDRRSVCCRFLHPFGLRHLWPGCLVVTNVAEDDALNMRRRPSASAAIVDALVPGQHGIIHLDAPCAPAYRPWPQRWCPVSHYNGETVTHGWVKARYVRDSDCP